MEQQNKLEGSNKPRRVKHSFTQSIKGTPEQVFPLLCPVREADWIPGWRTDWVISNSGVAEQNCIFQTPPRPGAGGAASIWVITRHDADAFKVEMFKVTPESSPRWARLAIHFWRNLRRNGTRSSCRYGKIR